MQFKEAARQLNPEDIADVLEVQAADAEDAAAAEDEPDTKTTGGAQAASDKLNVATEPKVKSGPKILQANSADTVKQAGQQAGSPPVINAAGATKDVHEADLDLTHADSAPGTLLSQLHGVTLLSLIWQWLALCTRLQYNCQQCAVNLAQTGTPLHEGAPALG